MITVWSSNWDTRVDRGAAWHGRVEERLEDYERRHRELAAQSPRSASSPRGASPAASPIAHRWAAVQRRPPPPHGPYCQWTAKVNGKTVTKRLTDRERSSTRSGSPTTAGCVLIAQIVKWRPRPAKSCKGGR